MKDWGYVIVFGLGVWVGGLISYIADLLTK
jgi:hypothetical protein